MKTWKENKLVQNLVKFITLLAFTGTISQLILLSFVFTLDVFETNSYEETYDYRRIQEEMMVSRGNYLYKTFFQSDGTYYNQESREIDDLLNEELNMKVLKEFEDYFSSDINNLQVKIQDFRTKEMLVDTFLGENYGKLSYLSITESDFHFGEPLEAIGEEGFIITYGLQSPLTVPDHFMNAEESYTFYKEISETITPYLVTNAGVLFVGLFFIVSMTLRRKEENITFYDKVPVDILYILSTIFFGLLLFLFIFLFEDGYYSQAYQIPMVKESYYSLYIVMVSLGIFVSGYCFMKTLETTLFRLKHKIFWKNTLLSLALSPLVKTVKRAPIILRTFIVSVLFCCINGILGMFSMAHISTWLMFALFNLFILVSFCGFAWQLKQVQDGAESLLEGKFETKIDTSKMYFDYKKYGETLNKIGDSISVAVDEKTRSQNMKTELITNVSHDIKTPLTSIVTCIELLQQEHSEEQQQEYLDLLQRQSMRMKKLIEDLVEASKASTGNLSINLTEMDLEEVISQGLGEYSEKFKEKSLQVICDIPEDCQVLGDGKHLWRVMDNLLGNICKYAQENTRVYVSVKEVIEEDSYHITLKNISNEPLNMTSEELMERFVRGDSSRTTEGSGLGLNIAQSLMQVQKGSLTLEIDGDLVKVTLVLRKSFGTDLIEL